MTFKQLKYFIIFLLLCIACSKNESRIFKKNIGVSFKDFSEILMPRGLILPERGGNSSLVLLRAQNDSYKKIYRLNHKTKNLELVLDTGKNISRLTRDPSYNTFYFTMDDGGNELSSIYTWNPETGVFKKFFGQKDRAAFIATFSRDAKRIYFFSNHETKKGFVLYRTSQGSDIFKRLSDIKKSYRSAIIDSSERYVALTKKLSNAESEVYILDLATKKERLLLKQHDTRYHPSFFHPQKPILYLNTNEGSQRIGCAKIDITKSKSINYVERSASKDISCFYNDLEDMLFLTETSDGRNNLKVFKGIFGTQIELSIPEKSQAFSFAVAPDTKTVTFAISAANMPSEYYSAKIKENRLIDLRQISNFNKSRFKKSDFADSFDYYFKAPDEKTIHSILFAKNEWIKGKQKYPLIVWIHGGPDSNTTHSFNLLFQYLVMNGYAVFAPQFRGSTGYGKSFERLNDGDWAGRDLLDVKAGLDSILKLEFIDKKNLFLLGNSFGGYLSLSYLIKFPNEFNAASMTNPITDLFDFMKNLPGDPSRIGEFLKEIGHPQKDERLYYERSPIFHTDKIKTPFILFASENDIRLSRNQITNFAKKAKESKIDFKLFTLKNDGHTLSQKTSWSTIFEETVKFFNQRKVRGSF